MCELNAATESHLKSAALCFLPKIGERLSGPGGARMKLVFYGEFLW